MTTRRRSDLNDLNDTLLGIAAVGWSLFGLWQIGLVCALLALAYARRG